MVRVKWLGRSLVLGPYLTLCTTQDEYAAAMKHLKCPADDEWVRPRWDGARTHIATNGDGDMTAVVCVSIGDHGIDAIAALMAHEAVHIWQHFSEHIGEDEPSPEFEAYSIQHITLELTAEYMRRMESRDEGV